VRRLRVKNLPLGFEPTWILQNCKIDCVFNESSNCRDPETGSNFWDPVRSSNKFRCNCAKSTNSGCLKQVQATQG
jgi:hypothetical protein